MRLFKKMTIVVQIATLVTLLLLSVSSSPPTVAAFSLSTDTTRIHIKNQLDRSRSFLRSSRLQTVPSPWSLLESTGGAYSKFSLLSITSSSSRILRSSGGHQLRSTTKLLMSSDGDGNTTSKKKKKTSGVYVRPSGAIERGSGFYVPGLEGPRVRLVVGCVLLTLTGVNHVLATTPSGGSGGNLPEQVALVYSCYVLFQALIEYAKEYMAEQQSQNMSSTSSASTVSSSGSNKQLIQSWASKLDNDLYINDDQFRSNVEWAAASYLALTPAASQMLLLSSGGSDNGDGGRILYRLGPTKATVTSEEEQSNGISAAFQALEQSKSGRIALPSTHPAVVGLFGTKIDDNDNDKSSRGGGGVPRTVVLQQITTTQSNKKLCWMMTSDTELLARFTQQDLKWLRQLGQHILLPTTTSSSS